MVKTIALLKRTPGLSPEEFRKHYEEVHGPLARRLFPFVRKYVRNYVTPAPFPSAREDPKYDCVTEEWYDNVEALQTQMKIYASEAGCLLREDEKELFDMTRLEFLFVEEVTSM